MVGGENVGQSAHPAGAAKKKNLCKKPFRSGVILAAALLAWSYFFLIVSDSRYAGDIRGFLCLGEDISHPSVLAAAPKMSQHGYDGQFYVALATDPLMRNPETVASLDNPAFRGSRIMIPWLAWVVGLGNAGAAVYAYLLLCWGLGLVAIFLAARLLAEDSGQPIWALLLIPSGGLAASFIRATPDAATVAFILAAFWFHRRGRFGGALIFCGAAVLAREISALAPLALAVTEMRKRRIGHAVAFAVVPVAAWFGWKVYMQLWLGTSFTAGIQILSTPFSWVGRKLSEVIHDPVAFSLMEISGLLAIAVSLIGGMVVATRKQRWNALEFSFLSFSVLIPFLSYSVFVEAWGFIRILIILPFLAILVAGRQTAAWRRWSLRLIAVIYAIVGVIMIATEFRVATQGRGLGQATVSAVTHLVNPSSRPRQEKWHP